MNFRFRTHDERIEHFIRAGLYLVTSQNMSAGRSTPDIICAALAGGMKVIQLREKHLSIAELLELGREARQLTREAGALLIINDRLDVAVEIGADGVHLGHDDIPVAEAREIAPDMIIGASSHSVAEALAAQKEGASYVNIGPLFPTATKEWSKKFLGLEPVRELSRHISIPFTVMGGIKKENIPDLINAGARIIAVVTAVTAADDPAMETRELLCLIASEIDRVSPGC